MPALTAPGQQIVVMGFPACSCQVPLGFQSLLGCFQTKVMPTRLSCGGVWGWGFAYRNRRDLPKAIFMIPNVATPTCPVFGYLGPLGFGTSLSARAGRD